MIAEQQILSAPLLIVDDQPANVLLLSRTLASGGFTSIHSTSDSREVLSLYERVRPAVVLLDLRMPHLDGFQLLQLLREQYPEQRPMVLVLTAYTDQTSRIKALELGARDFVGKPFDRAEVLVRIRNQVELRLMYDTMRDQSRQALLASNQLLLKRSRELSESEAKFRGIFDSIQDIFFRASLDGALELVSPSASRFGLGDGFAEGAKLTDILPIRSQWETVVALLEKRETLEDHELVLSRTGDDHRYFSFSGRLVRDRSGAPVGVEGTCRDVTERKHTQARLEHQACHDELTGLPNRSRFMRRLEHAHGHVRDGTSPGLAVLFLDIDRFKRVNDTLGHTLGDQVVIETARRLETTVRAEDTISRLGGDEYAILVPDIADETSAIRICDRLKAAINVPYQLDNRQVFLTCSIGVALCREREVTSEDLLRHADIAMYRAKWKGRDRIEFFEAAQKDQTEKAFHLEGDLRRAIQERELVVHFQPLLDLKHLTLLGAEALVRWSHPKLGFLPPIQFIPIADAAGLLGLIGEQVLRLSCAACRRWHEAGHTELTVAVNCSPQQLSQPGFVDQIQRILGESRLPAGALELEITEDAAMQDVDFTIGVFRQLKAMGVRLSIDDFGTGYSSLSYLKRFPLDVLKVDRSFVMDIPGGVEETAIATAIIKLGHTLGLEVLAEGIETLEQLFVLREQGCQRGQGYLFSKPVAEHVFVSYLDKAPWLGLRSGLTDLDARLGESPLFRRAG